ncbi:MAG: hypothetical protein FIA92_08385 [Chloroflexi bacterium]|nr:hypothetical protein [Chloroflexota bacterium]
MLLSRNLIAGLIAGGTILIAIAYAAFAPVLGYHVEWAGVTMLFALGVALGIMAFVLHTGPSEPGE